MLRAEYGIEISLGEHAARMVDDATGDSLDSVLCAIQAAWSYLQDNEKFGIPKDVDKLEGWIADPMFLNADRITVLRFFCC